MLLTLLPSKQKSNSSRRKGGAKGTASPFPLYFPGENRFCRDGQAHADTPCEEWMLAKEVSGRRRVKQKGLR